MKEKSFQNDKTINESFLFKGFKHKDYVFCIDIWSNFVVSGSADNTICVWNFVKGDVVTNLTFGYKAKWGIPVIFSRNGKYLIAGAYEDIVVFSLKDFFKVYSKKFAHKSGIQTLCISDDNNLLLTGGSDGRLVLWSIPDLIMLKETNIASFEIWSTGISRNGNYALCGGSEKAVYLFSFPDLRVKKRIENKYPVEFVNFSRDGKFFLFADTGGNVIVYKIDDLEKPARVLNAHIDSVLVARFLKDDLIISGGRDGDIYIYDVYSGNVLKKIFVGNSVFTITFGINNDNFVIGTEKGEILFYKFIVN